MTSFRIGNLVATVSEQLYDIGCNWATVSDEEIAAFKTEFGKAIKLDNSTQYGFCCELEWFTDPKENLKMPLEVHIIERSNGEQKQLFHYSLDARGGITIPPEYALQDE